MKFKPLYELMVDLVENHNKIIENQKEQEEIDAQILLNQCDLVTNQEAQDEVLAEILLNGVSKEA